MRYEAPESVEAAVGLLAAEKGLAKLLSGGTDLLVQMRSGLLEPDLIVDLKRIPGMRDIAEEKGGFRVGSAVSAAEMDEHPKLKAAWPGIVEAFDGRVATVRSDEAGATLRAVSAHDLQPGMPAVVAIRPEKVSIARHAPKDQSYNAIRGQVLDLGYFGNLSIYRVRLSSGLIVRISQQNVRRARDSERQVDWEDEVWLSWEPQAALVLTE